MERDAALDLVASVLETVIEDRMPVPVREVWVYGDIALGLDPVDRVDIYLTKDLLLGEAEEREADSFGVDGIGATVRADWADAHPEYVRANENGYAAPERCLGAHLLDGVDAPVHLEVCNAGFEDNVTQRLQGALARETYTEIIDPRGVCLWQDGTSSEDAMEKLRGGELVFPTLPEALQMLGMDAEAAEAAATTLRERRAEAAGTSVRGDVV
ncbi:MAG: hypothetical protein ABEJ57_03695 [Halobacteriaceae archaeon]